jgi:antitoxin VapB
MITLPPETEELARLVAQRSGKSPEDVLRRAIETEALLAGVAIAKARIPRDIDFERVGKITRRIAEKPLLDKRTPKEIRDQAWSEPG